MRTHATLAILVGLGLLAASPTTGAHPAALAEPNAACSGSPRPVHPAKAGGVTAGRVIVTCHGSWRAFQGVLYWPDDPTGRGRWAYGGTRHVTGEDDSTIPPWTRPYHGCGWWKQEWRMNSQSRNSQAEWFCAA